MSRHANKAAIEVTLGSRSGEGPKSTIGAKTHRKTASGRLQPLRCLIARCDLIADHSNIDATGNDVQARLPPDA